MKNRIFATLMTIVMIFTLAACAEEIRVTTPNTTTRAGNSTTQATGNLTEELISLANNNAKVVFNALAATITERDSRAMPPLEGTAEIGGSMILLNDNQAILDAMLSYHLVNLPDGAIFAWFGQRGEVLAVLIDCTDRADPPLFSWNMDSGNWNWDSLFREHYVFGTFPVIPEFNYVIESTGIYTDETYPPQIFSESELANGDAKVVFNAICASITELDSRGIAMPIPGAPELWGGMGARDVYKSVEFTAEAFTSVIPQHIARVPEGEITVWFGNRGEVVAVKVERDGLAGTYPLYLGFLDE